MKPHDVLRKKEAAAAGITEQTPDADIISRIVAEPALLQRPIVEYGDRALIARPAEKALELIGDLK